MKWTFLAGLGAGAAIGMLVAPKSGAELRDDIQSFASNTYEQGRDKLEPVVGQARQKLEPAVNQARDQAEPIMSDISQSVDRVMAQASDVRDRVVSSATSKSNGGLLAIVNEWPHERLIEIDGIGPVLATKIIQHRPYESEESLLNSKALPPSAIESLRRAA